MCSPIYLRGVVVGAVVDHHNAQSRVGDRGQAPDADTDHLGLVEAQPITAFCVVTFHASQKLKGMVEHYYDKQR